MNYLKELKEIAEKKSIEVLSGAYIDTHTPLQLRCKICNYRWKVKPKRMKETYDPWGGCPKCRDDFRRAKAYNNYKRIANQRNIEILTSLERYKNAKIPIKLECNQCGKKWTIRPENLKGSNSKPWGGCKSCRQRKKHLAETKMERKRILRELGDICNIKSIDLLSQEYKNAWTPLKLRCRKCSHQWKATAINNIMKSNWEGCPICKEKERKEKELKELKRIAKSKKGNIISDYTHSNVRVLCKCGKCGLEWLALPRTIKSGSWCPTCSDGISERICRKIFEDLFKCKFEPHKRFKWLVNKAGHKMHLDGYCSKHRIAFEYNGKQHYKFVPYFQRIFANFKKRVEDDKQKRILCSQNNIELIIVPYKIYGRKFIKNLKRAEKFIREECKKKNITILSNFRVDWKKIQRENF